ncbi:hypothetical protein [Actinomadura oligospora]|uniref:hypothetical protein n=1 Tax=Actinomadura oligospora TaxID=111804 RepID=UPI00047C3A1C|nr:hypothetical protein [Actinomadura oligospora]
MFEALTLEELEELEVRLWRWAEAYYGVFLAPLDDDPRTAFPPNFEAPYVELTALAFMAGGEMAWKRMEAMNIGTSPSP